MKVSLLSHIISEDKRLPPFILIFVKGEFDMDILLIALLVLLVVGIPSVIVWNWCIKPKKALMEGLKDWWKESENDL